MNVAFDVDDTIWRIRIREADGRVVSDQVPDYDLIQVLRWFAANGDNVYVWSAGGMDYAQHVVDKLGLTHLVGVIPKEHHPKYQIDLAFDDETVTLGFANCKIRRPDHQRVYNEMVKRLPREDAGPRTTSPT